MKLLLDTHIWVWSVLEPERVSGRVARAMVRPANEMWLSPLSIWESMLLVEQRRIRLNVGFERWVVDALATSSVREAPLNNEISLAAREFWPGLRDPVDALLAATARVLDLTLVTADERLMRIKGISVLANR